MQFWQLVAADDPKEFIVRIKRPKVPRRINRVTDPTLAELVVGDLETPVPFRRRAQHREAILG